MGRRTLAPLALYLTTAAGYKVSGCGGGAGRNATVVFAAHHKTGTYFTLALETHLCGRGRACCVFHVEPDTDIRDVVRRLKPRFVFTAFSGAGAPDLYSSVVDDHMRVPGHGVALVHLVRHPLSIVRSSYAYHASGHENHEIRLAFHEHTVFAGIKVSTYCRLGNVTGDAPSRLLRDAAALLGARTDRRHRNVLESLSLHDGVVLEAAWNSCEVARI